MFHMKQKIPISGNLYTILYTFFDQLRTGPQSKTNECNFGRKGQHPKQPLAAVYTID